MTLNEKYSTLKDQIIKLFMIVEHEKNSKNDVISTNDNDEIKSFELKIKSLLINDQSNLQNFYDNFISTVETKISSFSQNIHRERITVKNSFEELKNKFEVKFHDMKYH